MKTQFYKSIKWNHLWRVNSKQIESIKLNSLSSFYNWYCLSGFGDLCKQQNLISFCAYEVLKIIKMSCNLLTLQQRWYIKETNICIRHFTIDKDRSVCKMLKPFNEQTLVLKKLTSRMRAGYHLIHINKWATFLSTNSYI